MCEHTHTPATLETIKLPTVIPLNKYIVITIINGGSTQFLAILINKVCSGKHSSIHSLIEMTNVD